MADFCRECSIFHFGKDFEELKGLCKEGQIVATICEGCGFVCVDHNGKCQGGEACAEKHGQKEKAS